MPGPKLAEYGDSIELTFRANWLFVAEDDTGAIGRTPDGTDCRPRGIYVGEDGITFADGTQQTTAA